jgi:serine/threonine protein kinase
MMVSSRPGEPGRLAAGAQLGPYEIVELLGSGGMGEVYRAQDPRLQRDVAIKVLPKAFAQDLDRLRRFEHEARAASALNHPNILTVHDVGTQEATPYLVTELLQGQSLRDALRDGPLTIPKALDFGVQIARGLAAAHEQRIVHRDLKPENLFVTTDGRLKILDFGLARLAPQREANADTNAETATKGLTRSGVMLGTVGYMAPEQVRGEEVDSRSDIFAFGCVLYEMLAGRRPFTGASAADSMSAVLRDEPAPVVELRSGLPPSVGSVVHHCLEKDPQRRYQSARDLAFALETLSAPGGARPDGRNTVRPAPPSKRRLALWTLGAIAVALLGWGLGRMTPGGTAPSANPRPVVVLMDSPLPGRVYDPRTAASGGTNADDITDALRDLPVAIEKENTSPTWHREDQVLRANPDLIVSHLSALLDERVAQGQESIKEHLHINARDRLLSFFGYVAATNARTRFLVYSRGAFTDSEVAAQWVNDWETRLPAMRGRLHAFNVPGDRQATFRDADTARILRERVAAIIGSADVRP